GDLSALAVLQQYHHDQDCAYKYVNYGCQDDEHFDSQKSFQILMVRKGGFEPPRLSAPPPQDGVSASSTTSALAYLRPNLARTTPGGSPQNRKGIIITPNSQGPKMASDLDPVRVCTCVAALPGTSSWRAPRISPFIVSRILLIEEL